MPKRMALLLSSLGLLLSLGRPALADEASDHYNTGLLLKREGKLVEAAAELQKAIALRSEFAAAHFTLGNLYRQQGLYEKAADSIEHSLRISPRNDLALANLGAIYLRLEKLDNAILVLDKAALSKEDEVSFEALLTLGVVHRKKGDLVKAVDVLKKATEKKPGDAQGWSNLGIALGRTEDKEGAVVALKKAIALNPGAAESYFNLGVAHRRLRQTDEAIAAYEKAVSLDPKQAGAYYDLGILFSQHKENPRALEAFKNYLKAGGNKLSDKDRKDAEERIASLGGK